MGALRIKLDENIPVEAAPLLNAAGHFCDTVADEGLAGAPDESISAACTTEGRVLVTLDLDFADLRTVGRAAIAGVIVLRPRHADRASVLALITRLVPLLDEIPPTDSLWIVDDRRVRIRRIVQD